jgi:hypothetical protein
MERCRGKWKVYKSENFDELLKDIGKFCLTFLFTFVFAKQKEGKKKINMCFYFVYHVAKRL